jgi:hypothetical protein
LPNSNGTQLIHETNGTSFNNSLSDLAFLNQSDTQPVNETLFLNATSTNLTSDFNATSFTRSLSDSNNTSLFKNTLNTTDANLTPNSNVIFLPPSMASIRSLHVTDENLTYKPDVTSLNQSTADSNNTSLFKNTSKTTDANLTPNSNVTSNTKPLNDIITPNITLTSDSNITQVTRLTLNGNTLAHISPVASKITPDSFDMSSLYNDTTRHNDSVISNITQTNLRHRINATNQPPVDSKNATRHNNTASSSTSNPSKINQAGGFPSKSQPPKKSSPGINSKHRYTKQPSQNKK